MEVQSDFRRWDELLPDALGLIFSNLPFQEVLTVIPRVCKSWNKVVSGPYCWKNIDIEEWSSSCTKPEKIDRMIQMLFRRSSGSTLKLSVTRLQNDTIFSFIVENAGSLRTLQLPRCEITDSTVEQTAGKLTRITSLDLSYCCKIGARALEAIGKNCKALVTLRRNMHPQDSSGKPAQDDEAIAIATTMPNLKHLEMAYNLISTSGVLTILESCPKLEYLDLRGCWAADNLDSEFVKENFPRLKVLGPKVMDIMDFEYEMDEWDLDYCSDFSDGSDYLSWSYLTSELDDYDMYDGIWGEEDGLAVGLYDEIDGYDAGMPAWPSSP